MYFTLSTLPKQYKKDYLILQYELYYDFSIDKGERFVDITTKNKQKSHFLIN